MSKKCVQVVSIMVLVAFLAVFLFSFLAPLVASAETQSELKDKINKAKSEKQDIMAEKAEIDKKIASIQGEIDNIQGDIDELTSKINQKENELNEVKAKADAQYETMKVRLRTMYEDNSASYITLLFSGESLSDIVSYAELIKQVLNHDDNIYEEFMDTQKEIEKVKGEIETERTQEQEKKSAVEGKKSELKEQTAKLQSTADKLSSDIAAYQKAYDAAEAAQKKAREEAARRAAQAQAQAQSSGNTTYTYSGGKFQWPAPGYSTITSQHGWRTHPILKTQRYHAGIDIGVPMGSTIVAAEAGTVVTATYNPGGYGNYVVISHGSGVSTLYAHNSSLCVSVGQKVSRGQKIANAGSTGLSSGPHCHFEVLVNGVTVNPLSYL